MANLQSYLLSRLRQMKCWPLTQVQQQTIEAIEKGKSVFVNSPNGTGKTLAYLLPIMNGLMAKKHSNGPHGALIVVPTKELAMQVYRTVRQLDDECRLNVSRMGSISYYSGIVELLNKASSQSQEQDLSELALDNVIRSVDWPRMDLLVTTPTMVNHLLRFSRSKPNPKYVVLDQADQLIQLNEGMKTGTKNILRALASRSSIDRQVNSQRQFFLSCSSFPPKIERKSSLEVLGRWIPNLEILDKDRHTLAKQLQLKFVRMDEGLSRLNVLDNLLTDEYLKFKQQTNVIVFVKSVSQLRTVADELTKKGYEPILFGEHLDTNSRIAALTKFQTSQKALLLSTDLGSRGFDFKGVSLVIGYDMGKLCDFINRAGRTARFGQSGKMITLVDRQDEPMAFYIQQAAEKGESLDLSREGSVEE